MLKTLQQIQDYLAQHEAADAQWHLGDKMANSTRTYEERFEYLVLPVDLTEYVLVALRQQLQWFAALPQLPTEEQNDPAYHSFALIRETIQLIESEKSTSSSIAEMNEETRSILESMMRHRKKLPHRAETLAAFKALKKDIHAQWNYREMRQSWALVDKKHSLRILDQRLRGLEKIQQAGFSSYRTLLETLIELPATTSYCDTYPNVINLYACRNALQQFCDAWDLAKAYKLSDEIEAQGDHLSETCATKISDIDAAFQSEITQCQKMQNRASNLQKKLIQTLKALNQLQVEFNQKRKENGSLNTDATVVTTEHSIESQLRRLMTLDLTKTSIDALGELIHDAVAMFTKTRNVNNALLTKKEKAWIKKQLSTLQSQQKTILKTLNQTLALYQKSRALLQRPIDTTAFSGVPNWAEDNTYTEFHRASSKIVSTEQLPTNEITFLKTLKERVNSIETTPAEVSIVDGTLSSDDESDTARAKKSAVYRSVDTPSDDDPDWLATGDKTTDKLLSSFSRLSNGAAVIDVTMVPEDDHQAIYNAQKDPAPEPVRPHFKLSQQPPRNSRATRWKAKITSAARQAWHRRSSAPPPSDSAARRIDASTKETKRDRTENQFYEL